MADRLYTSQQADEYINGLRMETKLEKATLTRMAFAISLVRAGKGVLISSNFSGGELKRPTFFKEDETFIQTLVAFVYGNNSFTEDEFYSNKSIIKNHIDNGAKILWDLFEAHGKDVASWYAALLDEIELKGAKEKLTKDLDIFIGRNILTNDPLIMELNNTQKHANSHLAIMGKPGVGKTQFLLKILADIRVQSNYQTNYILFDYKGDVVSNDSFIEITRAKAYRLLQNNESLPINPFVLPSYDEQAIQVSAREKAESFASINSKFGIVQKGALTEAIVAAYAKRASSENPFPDFQDVLEIASLAYEEEGKKDDTLIEVLRDLANFNLFWSHGSSVKPIDKLTNRTMVIDVHSMPVLKELVAYLVIERLYKEMASLPDSPIKDGRRAIRTILVVDEAHNYLSQKNIFLQRIIREGRSKGIVVFFASQSPNDYQQKFFDFQELLEFAFVFQCEGVSASSIQDILGCSSKTAKDLQSEIARLEPFQVISRSNNKSEDFVKFIAEPFYKNY
ncbi:MAG TPA: DndE family protein [Bacteroidia bacterium]|nr:DndE family protein [Bacteroidia bacterium]HRS58539.1 DndE family protein [Bacteroidia bacterium]